jgi:hypothetical protein
MFHPEKELSSIIFEILKKDGRSISALSRELEEQGYKFHRLILTGYLRALTDLKLLKEKDVPPAKIYIPSKPMSRDIYETVGEKAQNIFNDFEKANRLTLYSLSRFFGRAIFEEEFKRTGFKDGPLGKKATSEERQDAKRFLTSTGFKIANSNRAFMPEEEFPKEHTIIMEEMVTDHFGISHLVKETKQTKLSL